MKIRLKKLDIYTHTSVKPISFLFESKITFIYGNIGVGKTTLLSLVMYCLGSDLVETPAVIDQFVSAGLYIEINSDNFVFRREYKSARIFVSDSQNKVYKIDKREISDFIYSKAGILSVYYEQNGTPTPHKITFNNYLWYSYLKQTDIDNNFFYLSKDANEFYQIASTNALASLLGKNNFVNKEQKNILSDKRKRLKKYENGKTALDYVVSQEFINYVNAEYDHVKDEYNRLRKTRVENDDTINLKIKSVDEKLRILGRVLINYNKFCQEYSELKKQVVEFSSNIPRTKEDEFEKNLHDLGDIFKNCLVAIGFPSVSKSDNVIYNMKNLNPTIVNEYTKTRYSFDLLGSGGKKTLFKICFLIAVHIKVQELTSNKNRLPSLIIIDTPMKNISEREDKELFDNFYKYLLELSTTTLSNTQLIIIDKERNGIINNDNSNVISISKEHPLFPEFLDARLWRER